MYVKLINQLINRFINSEIRKTDIDQEKKIYNENRLR